MKVRIIGLLFFVLLFFVYLPRKEEKIFAIMITGKDSYHHSLALCSIQSFLEQSYKNKHLLIINDGECSFFKNDLITEVKLNRKYSLGELRNIALALLPENAIWVQWDDDDWHHRDLIKKQVKFLLSHKADMCCLKNQVQYAFSMNAAWKVSRMIEGTIMCRKKNDILYPKVAKGEDTEFMKRYGEKYVVVGWQNPSYYYLRFIHGHNTWGEEHFRLQERVKDTWDISQEGIEYLKNILPLYSQ